MGQKSKLKVKIFHIFLTASGEGGRWGGVNPSGQPDRFFTVISQVPKLQAVDYNETGGHSNGEDCDETFLREY